jgi:hypothetical protein
MAISIAAAGTILDAVVFFFEVRWHRAANEAAVRA